MGYDDDGDIDDFVVVIDDDDDNDDDDLIQVSYARPSSEAIKGANLCCC